MFGVCFISLNDNNNSYFLKIKMIIDYFLSVDWSIIVSALLYIYSKELLILQAACF